MGCRPAPVVVDSAPANTTDTAFAVPMVAAGSRNSAPQGFSTAGLPSGPPVCPNTECGPAPMFPTQRCPDGQHLGGRGPCVRFANGVCGWTRLICPDIAQPPCDASNCGQPVYTQWSCPDQRTIGSFECVRASNGQCGMTYVACPGFAQSSPPPLSTPSPPPPPPPPPPRTCDPLPSVSEVATWPVGSMCSPGGGPDPGDVRVLMTLGDGTLLVNNNGRCQRVRFRTCHTKCLPKDALIATPSGDTPVGDLRPGMAVWTQDEQGRRVFGVIELISNPSVGEGHHVALVQLSDGRSFTASPEHPLLNGLRIQNLAPGDEYDGAKVLEVQFQNYTGTSTYDILPSGGTGVYWVNGVPVVSTIELQEDAGPNSKVCP